MEGQRVKNRAGWARRIGIGDMGSNGRLLSIIEGDKSQGVKAGGKV